MKTLNESEIFEIQGGVNTYGLMTAGLGGFGTGAAIGATVTGPFALVGGLVGGMLGTAGGVYFYMVM
jgi:hypothetical protein